VGVRCPETAREALDNYDKIVSKWKLFCNKPIEWNHVNRRQAGQEKAGGKKPRKGKA
jgi:hypothetical protein